MPSPQPRSYPDLASPDRRSAGRSPARPRARTFAAWRAAGAPATPGGSDADQARRAPRPLVCGAPRRQQPPQPRQSAGGRRRRATISTATTRSAVHGLPSAAARRRPAMAMATTTAPATATTRAPLTPQPSGTTPGGSRRASRGARSRTSLASERRRARGAAEHGPAGRSCYGRPGAVSDPDQEGRPSRVGVDRRMC